MESYCRTHWGDNEPDDIEYAIHCDLEAMLSSPSGREYDTPRLLDDLRTAAGGWWTRQDDDDPSFVTTAEWLEILTARQRRDSETT